MYTFPHYVICIPVEHSSVCMKQFDNVRIDFNEI